MSAPALPLADADAARRAAAAILREGRFHNPSVPRPLHGVLHDIGDGLRAVGHAVTHAVDRVGRIVPGGTVAVWVVLGLGLLAAISFLARRYSRRALLRESRRHGASRAGVETAADLERERPAPNATGGTRTRSV